MRSDTIHVKSSGEGIDLALWQADAVAKFKSLSRTDALHLRLLTEEMMGMLRAITGNLDADFWIEDSGEEYRLCLVTNARMNSELRQKLLAAATSGRNASATGVIGKLRDLFERSLEPVDSTMPDYYAMGCIVTGVEDPDLAMISAAGVWSLARYKESLEKAPDRAEQWDELEKSVIAKLADEVRIGINSGTVQMTVYKRFG